MNLKFVVKLGCFLSWCLLAMEKISLKISCLKSPTPTAFGELGHSTCRARKRPESPLSQPWVQPLNVSFELLGNRSMGSNESDVPVDEMYQVMHPQK